MTQAMSTHLGEALGTDFFSVREQFTGEQWSHFTAVRKFVDEEVVPVVGGYWEWAEISGRWSGGCRRAINWPVRAQKPREVGSAVP